MLENVFISLYCFITHLHYDFSYKINTFASYGIVEMWPLRSPLGPICVLDTPPSDSEDDDHSNVIPVLPVQSRDHPPTDRTARRRRRETAVEYDRSQGQRLFDQRSGGQRSSGENVVMRGTNERRADAAADITVSHYVTG